MKDNGFRDIIFVQEKNKMIFFLHENKRVFAYKQINETYS